MNKINYIDNDKSKGIKIDWGMIMKEYFNLLDKVCGDTLENFYVPNPPWNSARYFIDLSERSVGKTTNYILIGLLLFKHYGIRTEYIRLTTDGIAPKNARSLFNVILEFRYIPIIFEGIYNTVIYDRRAWYLALQEDDKILTKSEEFMHMHSLEDKEVDAEKSVYNSPRGNYIIVDEMIPINGINTEQQFLNFIQLHSTIRRQREVYTVMLANVINQYCHWFSELGINKAIGQLRKGMEMQVKTSLGVDIWLHYASFDLQKIGEKRLNNNLRYYGFGNPKLNSVTGCGEWQTKIYPHLPSEVRGYERRRIECPRIVFYLMGVPFIWEVWESAIIGLYAFVRPYTSEPDDESIVCKLEQPTKPNEFYGFPRNDLGRLILDMLTERRTFYATNDIGAKFEQYVTEFKQENHIR